MTEFFNRTITRTAGVWGPLFSDDTAPPHPHHCPNGELRATDERPVRTHWAVADSRVRFAATPVARIDLSPGHGSG